MGVAPYLLFSLRCHSHGIRLDAGGADVGSEARGGGLVARRRRRRRWGSGRRGLGAPRVGGGAPGGGGGPGRRGGGGWPRGGGVWGGGGGGGGISLVEAGVTGWAVAWSIQLAM